MKTIGERFWSKVRKTDGCWLWTGCKNGDGYGQLWYSRVKGLMSAHGVAYVLFVGPIPYGMEVCHSCDTPSCVNPNHLFLGTHNDNVQDMMRKHRDRHPTGENNGAAKLTSADVTAIRYLMESGNRQDMVAKRYGVHRCTIWRIMNHTYWKEVNCEGL